MTKILKQLLVMFAVLAVLALVGCDNGEGPMQTAGEKIDNAAETTGHAVKTGAEKTGEAVKTGAEKTGGALKTGGEAVENTVK